MKYLLIVESPSKCRSIEKYANESNVSIDGVQIKFKCVATRGHIVSLNTPKQVDASTLPHQIPSYSILKHQYKTKSMLNSEISKCNRVIIATDDDREGEFIAWQICFLFKIPMNTTSRIRFHEITKRAIQTALDEIDIGTINMNMVYSSMSRQWMDYCIGYMLSPYLWKYVGAYALSCGRCQTPALELIYQNENAIYGKKKEYNMPYKDFFKTDYTRLFLFPNLSLNLIS